MSEEVKIYRGTKVGEVRTFIVTAGWAYYVERAGKWNSCNPNTVTDLTELGLHPKGEGVWIEGVTAENLFSFLSAAFSQAGSQWCSKNERNIERILAQLNPTRVGGAE